MNVCRNRYVLVIPDGRMIADQDYISDTDARELTDDKNEALCFSSEKIAVLRAGLIRHLYGDLTVKQVQIQFPHYLRRVK